MKNKLIIIPVLLLFVASCDTPKIDNTELWKEEIIQTEKNFSDLSVKEGITKAFLTYAAEDAVLNRNDSLIIGIENIRKRFNAVPAVDGELTWEPEFVDVSESGDLGYTYGHYTFSINDSTANVVKRSGVFHTVWKRQEDGSWKYVWD